jgi:hypothetical protein
MAIRLPSFWANSPAAWFQMAEAHFTLRNVTDPVEKFLGRPPPRHTASCARPSSLPTP